MDVVTGSAQASSAAVVSPVENAAGVQLQDSAVLNVETLPVLNQVYNLHELITSFNIIWEDCCNAAICTSCPDKN